MKTLFLTAIACIAATLGTAQTAVDWTVNDCSGTSHHLFGELDAGKVVVLGWAMPCGTCIGPMQTVSTTVQGYSNPNVVFYLCDDYGNTICSTLNTWAATNGITPTATFSSAAIDMLHYSSTGMPKTVVLGGTSHTVYYNANGTVLQSELQAAIDAALAGVGLDAPSNSGVTCTVFPNPSTRTAEIGFTLASSMDVRLEVRSMVGELLQEANLGMQPSGSSAYQLNMESLAAGTYIITLHTEAGSNGTMLTITR